MKVRINKAILEALPQPISALVKRWRSNHSKSCISVNHATKFYIQEDACYTAFSPDLRSISVRAGGEWAGFTRLLPGTDCPLPPGCTAVATGFFLGHAWLTIYHNPAGAAGTLAEIKLELPASRSQTAA